MPPSQTMIAFNRCFEPTALNRKPAAILTSSTYVYELDFNSKNAVHSPLPQHHSFIPTEKYAISPPLSTSPASSISSSSNTTGSLTLEDDEIRRIFSNEKSDLKASAWRRSIGRPFLSALVEPISLSTNDVLNPHAQVFVPTLATIPDNLDPAPGHSYQYPPGIRRPLSPLDNHQCPPGMPHPPLYKDQVQVGPRVPASEFCGNPFAGGVPEHIYDPLVADALNPKIRASIRDTLAKRMVTSGNWTKDTIVGLAETICIEACQPSQAVLNSRDVYVCPWERYNPHFRGGAGNTDETRPQLVAMLADGLRRHLLNWYGSELSQAFALGLREVVLQTFFNYWDCSKKNSIDFEHMPTTRHVRSALALSAAVAELYAQNFISEADINLCVNALLSNLKSVEHVEALANIVLGCEERFWASTPVFSVTSEISPLSLYRKAIAIKRHVEDFMVGLEVNSEVHHLHDGQSVVGSPWAQGQLMSRLHTVANAVNGWEVKLQEEIQLEIQEHIALTS